MEFRFELPGFSGDPFDFVRNEVRARVAGPDGRVHLLPAFFDGGTTWAVRHTPERAGRWRLAGVLHNGVPQRVPLATTTVPRPGDALVRRDPADPQRLRAGAQGYWPLGHNLGWSGRTPEAIVATLARMGAAGLNWTRIWMCHWDGKNLDWTPGQTRAPGTLSLEVARRWDAIVAAAETQGVRLQMVLQHHGQYSTRTNPNWGENPWNARNGGFLERPEEFFTHPEAKRRTKAKYRYIVARWGYSPAILAWELFNEVEWVDSIGAGRHAEVAAWHREMAAFLRAQDPWKHLVTTSSDRKIPGLYDAMDYLQPHAYPPDPVATVTGAEPASRPLFYGEIGPSGDLYADEGGFLHRILWGSIAAQPSGAAQYWTWDQIERRDLYPILRAAAAFVRASGLAQTRRLRTADIQLFSDAAGAVSAGPGGGWGQTARTEFPVLPDGTIAGIGAMPAFLQGEAHRAMFPHADFPLDCPRNATFRVRVKQSARAGARLTLKVDGQVAATQDFPAAARDTNVAQTLEARLPAGRHVVRLENVGADWVVLERIEVEPYGAALKGRGQTDGRRAFLWLWNARPGGEPASGILTLSGLRPGRYRLVWWDTTAGRPAGERPVRVVARQPLRVATPAVRKDVAAYLAPG